MRILLSTIGSRGDVQPVVALASHLKTLGHEVRVCVPPDFREWIEVLGIAVTPIGPEVRSSARSRPMGTQPQSPLTLEQRRQMVDASVATQFETLTSAAQGCDAIVAATALQVAARSVAEKLGIAYVFAAYAPVVFPSPHHAPPPLPPLQGEPPPATTGNAELWARDAARFNDLFRVPVNAGRASLGLCAIDDVRSHMFTDQPWLAADSTLSPWPDPTDGRVFQTGSWILPDERPLSNELERFLEGGDPPVYFGFGSTRAAEGTGAAMVHAARTLGRRAIISRGWFDEPLVDSEPDCLSIGEVNMHSLFERVAAVVHHGGAGTTAVAALAGTSQVVIPNLYDQHYWAQRVHTLGIGVSHAAGAPVGDSLTATLAQSLRPEVVARARAVACNVRRDGTKVAAERLLALA